MTRALYRYKQRLGAHLPRLAPRIEVTPFPNELRPASISVMDNHVVGSLAPEDLRRALRKWGEIAAEPPVRYRPAVGESVSTPCF